MIGGAEEFAVAFILCHIQTSSGTWTVITNLFVGALLYTLAWMGLADLLYFVNAMTTIHFQRAASQYGRPHKVRAREMAATTGSSVHNQRVERFNRDLNIHCADVVKFELYELEHQGLLDPSDESDLFCLNYVQE